MIAPSLLERHIAATRVPPMPRPGGLPGPRLRDRLPAAVSVARSNAGPAGGDVLNALLGLGYNEREAQAAVKQLPEDLQLADAIRHALKHLAKP